MATTECHYAHFLVFCKQMSISIHQMERVYMQFIWWNNFGVDEHAQVAYALKLFVWQSDESIMIGGVHDTLKGNTFLLLI